LASREINAHTFSEKDLAKLRAVTREQIARANEVCGHARDIYQQAKDLVEYLREQRLSRMRDPYN
jgi:hypothetical protein